ncbi:MAG: prepilin-type N-terminal cleavage/methylation domain-containing protein [Planctomycetes bacterium]|nr:prepilin-type N-terminal cleavage/methylation domain-containing protein [Planctomycetota bacterium]
MKLRAHTPSRRGGLTLPRRRGGFTLIEILLALGVLLIGMTSVLGLLAFGAAMSRAAALRGESAAAAEAVFADLEERMFPLIVEEGVERVGEPIEVESSPVPGYEGLTYSARAEPDAQLAAELGYPLEYKVEVELSWTSGGRRRSRTYTTLMVREVPYGERLRRQFIERDQPKPPAKAAAPKTEK